MTPEEAAKNIRDAVAILNAAVEEAFDMDIDVSLTTAKVCRGPAEFQLVVAREIKQSL